LVAAAVIVSDAERVRFFSPEEFMFFLEEIEGEGAVAEEKVRGYRVKLQYKAVSEKEQKSRKQAIAQTIAQAFKRLKKE